MPLYEVQDNEGRKLRIEGSSAPTEVELENIFDKAFPRTPSQRPAISAPGESLAPVTKSVLTPVPQAFPAVEQKMADQQAADLARQPKFEQMSPEEAIRRAVRQEPPPPEPEIQPIGEPGTVLRGVTSVAASVLNRPEYLAALLNPATAAAVAIRFAPEVVMQFKEDVALAEKGDREALGRALAIGLPFAVGATKPVSRGVKGGVDVTPLEVTANTVVKPVAPATAEALKTTARELEIPKQEVVTDAIPKRETETIPLEKPSEPSKPVVEEVRQQAAQEIPVQAPGINYVLRRKAAKPLEPTAAAESVVQSKAAETITEAAGKVEPAAPASETVKAIEATPENTPTGIKNATVERERAARGLPPAVEPARRSYGEVWDEAMAKIDRDPAIQEALVAELRQKPRSLTDVEDAILLQRQISLQNEYAKASGEMTRAFDEGRLADVETVKARVGELSNQLLDLYNINKAAGTETGRGLAARRMMANEDFTLAKMETDMRVAKGGKPLTDAERADANRVATEFQRINRELETKLAEKEKALTEAQMARNVAEMQAASAKEMSMLAPGVKRIVDRVGQVLDTRAEAARKRLSGKLFSLSPDVIKDLAEIGASNIYHIGMDLAKWSAKMVADLGERVRPHLDKIWEASLKLMDDVTDVTAGKVTPDVKTKARDFLRERKARLASEIDKLEGKLRSGDLSRRTPRELKLDKEALDLQFRLEQVKQRWNEKLLEKKLAEENAVKKAFRWTGEVLNTARAILTSADFSAVLRQGKFIGMANPARSIRAFPEMLRAFRSERNAFESERNIQKRPNYPLYKRSGLYLAEKGSSLSKMEEAYMSRIAGKLPIVAGSARAYSAFLNRIRADSFDAMASTLGRNGTFTPEEAKVIANYINVSTGRGNLTMSDTSAVGLSTLFFAPRFVASRFQMALGQPLFYGTVSGKAPLSSTMAARKLIALEYAKLLAGYSMIYGLAYLAGNKFGTDPRSSDFGKFILGKTRVDPLAGISQVTVLPVRLGTGETVDLKGRVKNIRGDVDFGVSNAAGVIGRFLRTKLAPWPGAIIDALSGEDVVGHKVTPKSIAMKMTVPITYQDILDLMEDQGVPRGTALWILSFFGESVQTYDDRPKK